MMLIQINHLLLYRKCLLFLHNRLLFHLKRLLLSPSLHVNKRNQDQTPELQISGHANKEFLNKLPLCDSQGFNCKQVNNLNETSLLPQHVMTPCQSWESNSPLLSNRSRKFLRKIQNGHRHGIYQSKTSNLETSLLPQHVMSPCQSLESNSPLLSNRSRKCSGKIPNGHKHGIYQSKTSSLRDFTQPQRKIAPFR
jgi:hypothetical protein